MWNRLKNLVIMDAPEFWEQPLNEFMDDQLLLADGRALAAETDRRVFATDQPDRRGKTAQELHEMETPHVPLVPF